MIEEKTVNSVEALISEIKNDYAAWGTTTFPWFRGEPNNVPMPLLPRLYRATKHGRLHNENRLLQHFRMKAPTLGLLNTPPRNHTDEWLFLAQHVGLATRLLDWTEGLFVALYFALLEKQPAIWMLDPVELNRISSKEPMDDNQFLLTWFSPENAPVTKADLVALTQQSGAPQAMQINIGNLNIRGAWQLDRVGTDLPFAIHPTSIHPRMSTQKSCFTIQGKRKDSLSSLVGPRLLKKYVVHKNSVEDMRNDLRMMGITHSTVFPDLDNLAKDLGSVF